MRRASSSMAMAIGTCLVLSACASSGSSATTEAAGSTTESSATTSTIASTTLPPPEDAHLLDGEWLFTYVLESHSENFSSTLDPGDRDLFVVTMRPNCEVGPCDVTADFDTPYLDDDPGEFPLGWSDGVYVLTAEFSGWGDCSAEDGEILEGGLDLTVTVEVEPTEFEPTGSGWRVVALGGTRNLDWIPTAEADSRGCEPSTEMYTVMGVPYDPIIFEVPAGEPLASGSLLFLQKTDAGQGLVVKPPKGSETFIANVSDPYAVSPNGATLVYGTRSGLWIMSTDGQDSVEFFPNARLSSESALAWSADGARLAFVRDNLDEGTDVWTVEVPYGVPERITEGGAALGGVSWGPKDETLYFDWGIYEEDTSTRPTTFQVASSVYRYEFATGDTVQVAESGFRPAIGGQGEVLTYLVPDLDNIGRPFRWTIVRANIDGSNQTSVLTVALSGCFPNPDIPCGAPLSPDTSQVAFSDNNECLDCPIDAFDQVGVWVLDVGTGDPTLVVEGGWRPQWVK